MFVFPYRGEQCNISTRETAIAAAAYKRKARKEKYATQLQLASFHKKGNPKNMS